MLNAIAIDDEPIALEVVKSHVERVRFIRLVASFTDVFDATAFLQQQSIDLIFLDINMPDMTGIAFLASMAKPPMVIFTTAYSEHAVEGFELDAIDYLLKPFSLARFIKACNKAYEQYQLRQKVLENSQTIFIKSGYEQVKVELGDILYIEGMGNYVKFVLTQQKIASRLSMKQTEALLPSADFIRIHRSYVVAKRHISKIKKTELSIGQIILPIGDGYKNNLKI